MGRKSAEATNARLMWTSLREACVFFCADEAAAFFDFAEGDFAEGDFLLDV
jgi:hypothetical protein